MGSGTREPRGANQQAQAFYAHSREGAPPSQWHRLDDHLRGTAKRAAESAKSFGAQDWAYLAGLWHDVGKCSPEFQGYLLRENGYEAHLETQPGRVDHSITGASHAIRALGDKQGRLLGYAIAGHHAGLPDAIGGDASLEARLRSAATPRLPLPDSIGKAKQTLRFPFTPRTSPEGRAFQAALLIRMVFSALVDADFLDTERFMDAERARHRVTQKVPMQDLALRLARHLRGDLDGYPPFVWR